MANASSSIPTDPPDEEAGDGEVPLSGTFELPRELVATALSDPPVAAVIHAALARGGLLPAGPDAVEHAWTVVAHASVDVEQTLVGVRARMIPGAAFIAVVDQGDASAAVRAGATACVHLPLIEEELVSAVRLASNARRSHERIAALTRELDDQSELVSLGRVSAGITHEIATPLAVVSLSLECIERDVRALRRARDSMETLLAARDPAELERLTDATCPRPWATCDKDCDGSFADARTSLARVDDILTLMREVVGGRSPTLIGVPLEEVVDSVLRSSARVHLAEVAVERVVDESVIALVHPRLTEQILVNLISNAVAAARSVGSPRLRLHVYRRTDRAVISVRDNGPGIPPELHGSIFEPFFTTRRSVGGTGLGLALCREYARQMGGRITFWSEPGRGACFRLHLRLPQ